MQAKLKSDPSWTYYDEPLMENLIELRDVLTFREITRPAAFRQSEILGLPPPPSLTPL